MPGEHSLSLGGLRVRWDDPSGGDGRVALAGELDSVSAPVMEQALASLLASGCSTVFVDLSAVEFIDSRGLGTLVKAWRSCGDRDGRLVAVNPTAAVRRLLELTGIGDLLLPPD